MKYYPKCKPGKPCPINEAIMCADQSQCSRCGWDPKVAEERLQAVIKELKEKRRAGNG